MTGKNKMMQMVGARIRLAMHDGRILVGQLVAFDKHLNVVIADCEEFRPHRQKAAAMAVDGGEEAPAAVRRTLGFVMLRGQHIVTLVAEAAPAHGDAGANRARIPAAHLMAPPAAPHPAMAGGRGIPMPGAPPLAAAIPGMFGGAARPSHP